MSKKEYVKRLEDRLEELESPDCDYEQWLAFTCAEIEEIFPASGKSRALGLRKIKVGMPSTSATDDARRKVREDGIERAKKLMQSFVEQLRSGRLEKLPSSVPHNDIWHLLVNPRFYGALAAGVILSFALGALSGLYLRNKEPQDKSGDRALQQAQLEECQESIGAVQEQLDDCQETTNASQQRRD